jgi:hypothetical protein
VNAQLQGLIDEFHQATERLQRLVERVPDERLAERADPLRWSVGECIAHLNLTAQGYAALVAPALEEARRLGGPPPRRYRRDWKGWLLWKSMPPPVRLKVKTAAAFVPQGSRPAAEILGEFRRLQAVQIGWVEAADGLPIDRVRITSPFDARVRYNLFSGLSILPRHQHRHLWQAENVAKAMGLYPG